MKRYILLFVIIGMAIVANSAPVSRGEASTMAASFLNQSSVVEVKSPFDQLYIFNGEECFVILSAEDCAMPVLGYSRNGCFEVNAMLPSTLEWLQAYMLTSLMSW